MHFTVARRGPVLQLVLTLHAVLVFAVAALIASAVPAR